MVCVWFQNIDGIMMARQFDTSKHSECYRPIPVHTPSSRRLPVAKTYMNTNSETATSPRYESEYDYKTTHYPSYPSNYPYDDSKYKYEAQGYNHYEKQPTYTTYEETSYDSRNYMAPAHTPATPSSNYPAEAEYTRYPNYEGRSTYPTAESTDYQQEKSRYGGYGYDRTYYEADGRYLPAEGRHSTDARYSETRHAENRNTVDNREADCRYPAEGREAERRYPVDGREEEVRYVADGRDGEARYTVEGRAGVEGRFAEPARYPQKENYYDRYYKHRPSRDHHVSETSRY